MQLGKFLKSNPKVLEQAKACKSAEELNKLFEEHGVSVPEEYLNDVFEAIREISHMADEDALEAVSGGLNYNSAFFGDHNQIIAGGNIGIGNQDTTTTETTNKTTKIF